MSSEKYRILLVEDDRDFRESVAEWFERRGHLVSQAATTKEAVQLAEGVSFDLALFDMCLPEGSGLDLLARFRDAYSDTATIVLTGTATVENAVEAMKRGASDYLIKPFPLGELEHRCRLAIDRSRLQRENARLKTILTRGRGATRIIGESAAMQSLNRLIQRVGPTDKTVLIEGESGTGKELVARRLQESSPRADRPLITVNCATLPEQLIESELFGHEKGAFTGAVAPGLGLFEAAHGGTLFIDELGELPLALQPKLLRILEDGTYRRVGSVQERRVDVRVLAATNRHLADEVRKGTFREDLYYRINVFTITLPPLRQRVDDIPPLIRHFLGPDWEVDGAAQRVLEGYAWPGNVRQLKNLLERATILAEQRLITIDDLPAEVVAGAEPSPSPRGVDETPSRAGDKPRAATEAEADFDDTGDASLDAIERAHIVEVLAREQGNKSRAARALGIHRRKLYRLLARHGIEPS